MRAFQVTAFDTPPALQEIPMPSPGAGEVLIRIEACGLNFADLLMVKGTYQETPKPPFTLGLEICGTVIGHGPDVSAPAIGTRVAVFGGQGGLAEYGVFAAARCLAVPETMSSEIAAGFMVAYGTSHLALGRRARLQPGETLLVLGAAGGVGLTAVEIGHAMGARVIAVARGSAKLERARLAGADILLDSDDGELRQRLKDLGGVDVVYDPVGGAAFDDAFRATNREGRIIVIGFASGTVPEVPLNVAMVKNIDILGVYWGGYLSFAPDVLNESLAELMQWHADGRLRPHVSHSLPLDRAAEALEMLSGRRSTGKVVVTM
ncbi:NADPH:quinone oxidoreductase family protein [Flavimaricola marinus]|uniref:Alcohol dehydrogenase n=1 Tax=Flavimaricola marinus TaxID=1819565 RepID=A0A238LG53_9RHOB|nr:NADPH:quinone oxidoreductase family protein [Flavimaricola marinus]SMY08562.1 Alcohol dehydrogenase [Flavimaricola marinus]